MRSRPAGVRRRLTVTARSAIALVLLCATTLLFEVVAPAPAQAITVPVPLGSAAGFAVLAGATITSAGVSTITGDVGVSPGSSVTGFPPGVINGVTYSGEGPASAAKADLAAGYADAIDRPITGTISDALGGSTHPTGVYASASGTFGIAGTVTLDAEDDPDAVFIFRTSSTIITAADSAVVLVNGAQACNVFWQVGSSATFGANTVLAGNVLANTSVTVGAGVQVDGRVMAITGAVTMDNDTIARPTCLAARPGELSITVPTSVDLGDVSSGGVLSGNLGPVTVSDERGLTLAGWEATVVATDFVAVGAPARIIGRANVSYWSGPSTDTDGTGTFTSEQPTSGDAETLDTELTAFTLVDGGAATSVTWDPSLSIRVPIETVAGEYTATLTFSVA